MKIIIIGAVGSAACDELGGRHEIVKAGRNSGDVNVDIADREAVSSHRVGLAFAKSVEGALTGKVITVD